MSKKLLVVALAAVGAGVYFFTRQKTAAEVALPSSGGSGFKTSSEGKAVVSVPTGVSRVPLILVYGGITSAPYATKEAIAKVTPDSLKKRALILFVNTKSGAAGPFVQQARAIAAREGLTITDAKLLGFSAGGADVQNNYSGEWSFVGLIDPSTNARYVALPWNARARMIYNTKNWGAKYANIIDALPKVAAAITRAGGKASSIAVSHRDMVPKFFAMFEGELASTTGVA